MNSKYLKHLKVADALEIAQAATEWAASYDSESPGIWTPPSADDFRKPPSEEAVRLKSLVSKLTIEEMSELTALFSLGRSAQGETVEDWDQLVKDARSLRIDADHLCSRLELGPLLMKGLQEIGDHPA